MKKRKLKPIKVDLETYKIMQKIWGTAVPYNPTVIENDKEEEDEPRKEGT